MHISNEVEALLIFCYTQGVLSDKSLVAIKRLKIKTDQALQDFLNEIVAISYIKHRNLVQLKGCCIKGDERFLIYEFVENKNLAEALWGIVSTNFIISSFILRNFRKLILMK